MGVCLQTLGHGPEECQDRQTGPLPFIVGGDFNLVPQMLASSGFAESLQAAIVAPRVARGTCRTGKSHKMFDYFVLSRGLEQGLARVTTREDGLIKTHVPVVAAFRPRLTMLRALAVRTPPTLPVQRVYGPLPAPPDWRRVRDKTMKAVRAAKGEAVEVAQDALDAAYEEWARKAEEELQDITGVRLPKAGPPRQGPPPGVEIDRARTNQSGDVEPGPRSWQGRRSHRGGHGPGGGAD